MIAPLRKKIGISFSGEGWGHAARVVALSEKLFAHVDIEFWAPQNLQEQLRSVFPGTPIHSLPLIRLIKKNHRVDYIRTGLHNFENAFRAGEFISKLSEELTARGVHAILSDYDPFLPKAAKKARIPILLLNHQGILKRHRKLTVESIMAQIANSIMIQEHDEMIVCSFYDGDVGPILRDEIRNAKLSKKKHITVYVKETMRERVLSALSHFPDYEFHIFPDPNRNFVKSLASARGVIAPGGHQMLSECLFLKKPVLSIPELGQYEQRLNATMLQKSGYGIFGHYNTLEKEIAGFLEKIDHFPVRARKKGIRILDSDHTQITVDKILDFVHRHS